MALREAGIALEPSQIVEDVTTAALMMEIDRGETFVAAPGAAHYERSGLAKAVAIPSLPPIQMVWVARSFALLPDTATEFLAICNEIVTRR